MVRPNSATTGILISARDTFHGCPGPPSYAPLAGLSIWIGWTTMDSFRNQYALYQDPRIVVAAGLAAGFAYWAVAGWNAGFWKPVFQTGAVTLQAGEARPRDGNAARWGN